jgi:hypothetical protein
MPVLQVLRDINNTGDFVNCFKHLSPKHHKLKPTAEIVLAEILGMGCNIGIDKLSQISVGINESTLKNTVNWQKLILRNWDDILRFMATIKLR